MHSEPHPRRPLGRFLPTELSSPEGWKGGVTLYAKALSIFSIAVLLLFGALYGLSESLILSQFESIEREQMKAELARVEKSLEDSLQQLTATLEDWSNWSEMAAFVDGQAPDFPAENLDAESMRNIQVDALLIWNRQAQLLACTTPSGVKDQADALEFARLLAEIAWVLPPPEEPSSETQSGLLLLQNQVFLFARAPILNSQRTGPPVGTLAMGRRLNRARLDQIQPLFATETRLLFLSDLLQSPSRREDAIYLLAEDEPLVRPLSEEEILGAILLRDALGQPLAVLDVIEKRNFFAAGQRAVRIFLLAMTAAGGGLVVVLWIVFDWNLLRKLKRMENAVRKLSQGGAPPPGFPLETGDELGRLSRSIQDLHRSLLDAEADYRRLFQTSNDGTVVLSLPELRVMEANPAFAQFVETPLEDLLGRPLGSAIPVFPVEDLLRSCQAGQPYRRGELLLRRREGLAQYAEVIGVRFDSPGGDRIQVAFRDVTQRRRAEGRLRELSGQLLRLQDDERRRIARELHDSTAQNLTALEMNLTLLEKQIPRDRTRSVKLIQDTRHLAEATSREIRTISYLLHPPLLDEVGLLFAIRWFVEGYTSRTGIVIELDLPDTLPRFPAELETTIFRIVQESLTNIYRHAKSPTADIILEHSEHSLELHIQDHGEGFAPDNPTGQTGLGLAGMKERVRQSGGEFLLESSSSGTLITVQLPLTPTPTDG
jgi:two-component system NarL family sensor kinase